MKDPKIRQKLLAAGGSWFLFDIIAYGLGLLAPYVIDAISADDDNVSSDFNVQQICSKQMTALVLSVGATIVSIFLLPPLGLKRFQTIAFFIVSMIFLVTASSFTTLRRSDPGGLFALYCLCSMSLNFGLGITTFAMPAALFPQNIRSTFNGISCAMGKTGAIVGAYSFFSIAQATSYEAVLGICAVVAVMGACLTHFCADEKEIAHNSGSTPAVTAGDASDGDRELSISTQGSALDHSKLKVFGP